MNINKNHYLSAMGIQTWQQTTTLVKSQCASAYPEDWEALRHTAMHCIACSLHLTRKQVVFGIGNQQADLVIVGEAPGYHEDQQGEPFVGRAGQLLNAMLQAINSNRSQVYIANIIKCRPPENRDPMLEEVNQCTPYLQKQIALIQPKMILALGRIAAQYLLNTKAPLSQMRSKTHTYGNNQIPLVITYHPAYLLRNPQDKEKAFVDLQLVQQLLKSLSTQQIPLT